MCGCCSSLASLSSSSRTLLARPYTHTKLAFRFFFCGRTHTRSFLLKAHSLVLALFLIVRPKPPLTPRFVHTLRYHIPPALSSFSLPVFFTHNFCECSALSLCLLPHTPSEFPPSAPDDTHNVLQSLLLFLSTSLHLYHRRIVLHFSLPHTPSLFHLRTQTTTNSLFYCLIPLTHTLEASPSAPSFRFLLLRRNSTEPPPILWTYCQIAAQLPTTPSCW